MGFSEVYDTTAVFEGGYSDNPKDKGGPTMYGITEQVARANGYTGDMKDLPKSTAEQIAKTQYWDIMRLDDIDKMSPDIAQEMYDTGLNCGVGNAGKFLQRALNVFNREQQLYKDLTVDGVVGPVTVSNLRSYLQARGVDGVTVMTRALNSLQGSYYVDITEKREANEEFTFGWFLNRVTI